MAVADNQWMLFGIDMRHIGQQWIAAWNDLLYGQSSPLRQRLDEPVLLLQHGEQRIFLAGVAQSQTEAHAGASSPRCVARLLPDELVLARRVSLPLAAEAELAAVLQMEVAAGSPFAMSDTVYGWSERSRDAQTLELTLAIASRAALMQWLRETARDETGWPDSAPAESGVGATTNVQQFATPSHLPGDAAPEIWAEHEGSFVTLGGFGEQRRERLYRQRLGRAALLATGALLALLVVAGLFAIQQRLYVGRLEALQADIQRRSQGASQLREALVDANESIRAANALIAEYPNPHPEIARLSELLSDSVYVAHFSMRGRQIRVQGRATDAAVVMQTLAETPAFAAVTAPQPISALGNTGLEQFYLDIELAPLPVTEAGE